MVLNNSAFNNSIVKTDGIGLASAQGQSNYRNAIELISTAVLLSLILGLLFTVA